MKRLVRDGTRGRDERERAAARALPALLLSLVRRGAPSEFARIKDGAREVPATCEEHHPRSRRVRLERAKRLLGRDVRGQCVVRGFHRVGSEEASPHAERDAVVPDAHDLRALRFPVERFEVFRRGVRVVVRVRVGVIIRVVGATDAAHFVAALEHGSELRLGHRRAPGARASLVVSEEVGAMVVALLARRRETLLAPSVDATDTNAEFAHGVVLLAAGGGGGGDGGGGGGGGGGGDVGSGKWVVVRGTRARDAVRAHPRERRGGPERVHRDDSRARTSPRSSPEPASRVVARERLDLGFCDGAREMSRRASADAAWRSRRDIVTTRRLVARVGGAIPRARRSRRWRSRIARAHVKLRVRRRALASARAVEAVATARRAPSFRGCPRDVGCRRRRRVPRGGARAPPRRALRRDTRPRGGRSHPPGRSPDPRLLFDGRHGRHVAPRARRRRRPRRRRRHPRSRSIPPRRSVRSRRRAVVVPGRGRGVPLRGYARANRRRARRGRPGSPAPPRRRRESHRLGSRVDIRAQDVSRDRRRPERRRSVAVQRRV